MTHPATLDGIIAAVSVFVMIGYTEIRPWVKRRYILGETESWIWTLSIAGIAGIVVKALSLP